MYRGESLGNPVTIWLRNRLRYDIIAKNFDKKLKGEYHGRKKSYCYI